MIIISITKHICRNTKCRYKIEEFLQNRQKMGATMVKNGNLLDALPSQVVYTYHVWRQTCITKMYILKLKGTLHVVMLGLDSAGKTTALYRLKFDQYLNTVPTIGFNCEKVGWFISMAYNILIFLSRIQVHGTIGRAKGVHFLVWDVGGQEKLRPLWRSYTRYERRLFTSMTIMIGTLSNGTTDVLGMIMTFTFDFLRSRSRISFIIV